MIYTLTLNPALDLSGHVARLVANEKNYVERERRDPGGNGINAARVARRLGGHVLCLGFAGGAAGDEIRAMLDCERVAHRFTSIAAQTRVNVTVTNDADHRQTRLTFHGPRVTRAEIARLLAQLSKLKGPGVLALGGSAPPGCPDDMLAKCARAAARAGLELLLDVPARHLKHYYASRAPLPLLIKPNETELEEWTGRRFGGDLSRIARAAQALVGKRARLVCVSLAERGALLATAEGVWHGRAPRIKARGSVGAGDSMVGAMATRLERALREHHGKARALVFGEALVVDALRWGLAAGAATASVEGTTLARPSLVRELHARTRALKLL